MSILLYRLGRSAFRHPWRFILPWVVLVVAVLAFAVPKAPGAISSGVTIDGTQSQDVLDELRAELPEASGGQGTIVFAAPDGQRLDTGDRAAGIAAAARTLGTLADVSERAMPASPSGQALQPGQMQPGQMQPGQMQPGQMQPGQAVPAQVMPGQLPGQAMPTGMDPGAPRPLIVDGTPAPGVLVSPDGSTAMLQLQFTKQIDDLDEGTLDEVVATAEDAVTGTDLTVLPSDSLKPMHAPIGGHEAIGLGVAALVLLLTLGSLFAAGLPLLTAVTGVAIGLGSAFALSGSIQLTTATPVLALMVGLAVGMDYALFIVNRQRRLIITEHLSAEQATARALGTAGSAVVFAGATVIVALAALAVIGISFLTTMALVAAATVLFAVLIAMTMLPALLGLVGERVASARARARHAELREREERSPSHWWSTILVRRPWVIIVTVMAVLGLATVPAGAMRLGMPNGSSANTDTTERQSYDAITTGFGEGYNGPLIVVARPHDGETLDQRAIGTLTKELSDTPDAARASVMGAKPDGSIAIFTVVPEEGPLDESTADLVHALRSPDAPAAATAALGVTGMTAVDIDISEKLADVLPEYIAIIVVMSLLILLLVFRSVLIPVKATLGFLLSIMATFGILTAVFEWGWFKDVLGFDTTGPLVSFLPIMVTGILYGLAMDYEVFLVSSMRQAHVHGHRGKEAIVHGFAQSSRVVVAAAIIMVSVFAGFIFTDDPTVKQLGTALATGILIDAFLVRMTLVPAVMALLGKAAWWLPGWLGKLLPNLDIEGDKLSEYVAAPVTEPEPEPEAVR